MSRLLISVLRWTQDSLWLHQQFLEGTRLSPPHQQRSHLPEYCTRSTQTSHSEITRVLPFCVIAHVPIFLCSDCIMCLSPRLVSGSPLYVLDSGRGFCPVFPGAKTFFTHEKILCGTCLQNRNQNGWKVVLCLGPREGFTAMAFYERTGMPS